MQARRWLLVWVLFALVCAQALGLVHGVAHPRAAAAPALEAYAQDAREAQHGSWTAALFPAHSDEGCRLLDGIGQALPLPPALAALVLLPAGTLPALPAGAFVGCRTVAFEARGPPVSR